MSEEPLPTGIVLVAALFALTALIGLGGTLLFAATLLGGPASTAVVLLLAGALALSLSAAAVARALLDRTPWAADGAIALTTVFVLLDLWLIVRGHGPAQAAGRLLMELGIVAYLAHRRPLFRD